MKIFTARCSVPEQLAPVAAWLEKHGLGGLEITNVKDFKMIELWDDRCVQVITNTGMAARFTKAEAFEYIQHGLFCREGEFVIEDAT